MSQELLKKIEVANYYAKRARMFAEENVIDAAKRELKKATEVKSALIHTAMQNGKITEVDAIRQKLDELIANMDVAYKLINEARFAKA